MAIRPVVVTSKTVSGVAEDITSAAWEILSSRGTALDAAIAATNVSESDVRDTTVGYGGCPNEEGYLQLDASVMSGADGNNAGAVAALENIKTPCSVARLVMERLDHLLLVGKGALKYAKACGFEESDLVTEDARRQWVDWKSAPDRPGYYLDQGVRDGCTINVLTLDSQGNLAGVTSTVGHHFKLVGRVGDSAIIGAGLYVDNEVGAAGATGHGEESIKVCASFLAVEKMREGMSPEDACSYVCQRIIDRHSGNPMFNVKLLALSKDGHHGAARIRSRSGAQLDAYCVRDHSGHRILASKALLRAMTEEEMRPLPLR